MKKRPFGILKPDDKLMVSPLQFLSPNNENVAYILST